MNRIFRIIWSRSVEQWIPVSEVSGCGSAGPRRRSAALRALLVVNLFAAGSALPAWLQAAPTGAHITAGSGAITQSGTTTTIRQNSANLSLNWQSFNVASDEIVDFVQPNSSALAINRILGNTGSQIFGHLNSNGQVWLINPNGILFGRGAQVNVGGLTASTLDVSDAAFASNLRTFSGTGTGSVVNQGSIHAAAGGYVALLGNHVSNQGVISAQLGTVALGAGSTETLTFSGRQLIHLKVEQSTLNDMAENGDLIQADGGRVIMTAGAQNSLLASVVNNTGVVQARTVENHGGTITLLAGMTAGVVDVAGTLDATAAPSAPAGQSGGSIETSGAAIFIASSAKVVAGRGGSWRIDPDDLTIDAATATAIGASLDSGTNVSEITTATTASGSGVITPGLGDINVNSAIAWTNPAATLTLTAYNAINVNATVTGGGPVVMQAGTGNLTIAPGAAITGVSGSGGAGVTLGTAANFVNQAGAGALAAGPGGHWLVYSTNPTLDTTGALAPDFIQYAAGFQAAPAGTGNGLLYSVAPSVTVTALGGTVSKVYDGNQSANLTAANSNYTITGTLNGDTVTSMAATYATANVGSSMPVTSTSTAAGLVITNAAGISVFGYGLTGPTTASIGTITPAQLSAAIVGDTANPNLSKVYDGTTTATLDTGNYQISGFVTGQSATVKQPSSVAYASSQAGAQSVDATFSRTNFVAGSGTTLSNYALPTTATGSGSVLQAPLVITGVLATNKVYDTGNSDALNTSHAGIYGKIGNDVVSLSAAGATGTFASTNVGNNLGVTTEGFILSGAQMGDYQLVQPSGLSANITPAALNVSGVTTAGKIYDGNATAALTTTGATLSGALGSDATTLVLSATGAAGAFATKNVGSALPVTITGFSLSGTSALNYSLVQQTGLTADITPKSLTVTLGGDPTKPYNGTTTADLRATNFTLTGFVSGEGASIPQTTLSQYDSKNAGARTVTATLATPDFAPTGATSMSNYTVPTTVTGTGTITPAPLTGMISGNPTKVYDTTTSATLSNANYTFSGFLAGEGVTVNQTSGIYAAANAGPEQVTASLSQANYAAANGATLLSNYSLPTTLTGSGSITQAAVTGYVWAGIAGNPTKPYDGNTTATLAPGNFVLTGFLGGQGATVTQTVGQYVTANAGAQTVTSTLNPSTDFTPVNGTVLSDYHLPTSAFGTGTITPTALTVTIGGDPTRVYNGSTAMVLSSSNYTIAGFVSGQSATINPSALINYASANAGAQTVTAALTPSAYTVDASTLMSNYVMATSASGPGHITPAPLYVTGVYATNKVYDTTTADPLNIGSAALAGVVGADAANLTLGGTPTGSFGTIHVGSALPVTVGGYSISGTAAPNYTLQPINGLAAAITPAPLNVAGVTANAKPYDGTNTATLNTMSETLTGLLGFDAATLSDSNAQATFGSVNVGAGLRVTASGFTVSGGQSSDYSLSQPAGLSADITKAPITATIIGNPTKVYDGSSSTTLTSANYTLGGFATVGGVTQGALVPQSATANYAGPDAGVGVGIGSTLVLSDFVANAGTNLSNYALPATGTGTGTITQAPLSVALIGNPTKVYDSTQAATLTSANYTLAGFVGSQSSSVTQSVGAYASANAGSRSVTATLGAGDYAVVSGTNLSNYALPVSVTGPGTITRAPLTVSATTTSRPYDGTTVDALSGVTLSTTGVYSVDAPVLAAGTYTSGTLNNSGNAGNDTVTTNIGLSGTGSGNYVVIQPSGLSAVIAPVQLSATSLTSKTYDGTTNADLSGSKTTLSGFIGLDGATVSSSGLTGTFATPNAGTGIVVTGGALTGANLTATGSTLLSNYILPTSDNGTGTISPATLTYLAANSSSQYGLTPTGLTGSVPVSGFVNGETLATATTGNAVFSTLATGNSNVGQYEIDGAGLTANNGNYAFLQAAANATALTITKAPLSVTGVMTTSRAYDGTAIDALTGTTITGTIYNNDVTNGVLTFSNLTTGTLSNSGNVGTDSVTTNVGLGGSRSGNYSITQQTPLSALISSLALTATSTVTRTYNGTTTASLSGTHTTFTGFLSGQGATVNSGVNGTFTSANAGSGIAITGAALTTANLTPTGGTVLANYSLPANDNGTGTITPKAISVALPATINKVYDSTAAATLTSGNYTLTGFVGSESATLNQPNGIYSLRDAGPRGVTSTLVAGNYTAGSGTLLSNYTLPLSATGSGTIAQAPLTVSVSTTSRPYDATTADALTGATLLGTIYAGDTPALATGTYTSGTLSNNGFAGTDTVTTAFALSGTRSSNYSVAQTGGLTAAISALTLTATSSVTKPYDGTTTASLAGANTTFTGFVGGQTATVNAGVTGTFASADAASGITITGGALTASNLTLSGTNASFLNYVLPTTDSGSGTISPLAILATLPTNLNKVYDSTTAAALVPSNYTLTGFVSGQSATVNQPNGIYASANVGTRTVTSSLATGNFTAGSNTNFADYTLPTFASGGSGVISAAVVNLTGTRVYNGLTDANFSILSSGGTVNGVNGQTLALSGSGTLNFKNVGLETFSPTGLTLANGTGGTAGVASNYTLLGGADSVNVTAATLTYNANPASRFYGVTPAGLTGTVSGYVAGDTLANSTTGTAVFTTLATSNSNVGQYAINGAGLTANNGNYTFAAAAGNATALSVTPAVVSLTGTRAYDGLTDANFSILSSGGTVNGVNGQTLTLSGSGTLATKNAGMEILSPSGLTLADGTGGNPGAVSNYTLVGGIDSVNVTAAMLTYNANPASRFYGTTPTGLTGTVSGYATGDTLGNSTTGTAVFSTLATSSSNVGQYAINGAGLTANNGNYTFAAAAGNATALSITPAVVSLTGTRAYDGLTDANFSILSSGGTVNGVNGQTLTLSGSGTLASRNAGTEPLSPTGLTLANGTGAASNYTLVGGTDSVNVTAATLIYNATPASQQYGATPTGLTGTVTGYATGDTLANSTSGTAAFTTAATSSSNVGQYAINGAGLTAVAGNYTFAQAGLNATALSITPAVVSLTGTRAYDGLIDANFSILSSGGSVNGVNGQTLTLSGSATLASRNAGTEPLSPTGLTLADGTGGNPGAASNYTLVGGTDSVNVTAATLTYNATPAARSYGTTPTGLTGTVSGLQGGDSLSTATAGTAVFSTLATSSSNVGQYAINGAGLTANNGNYTFAAAAGNAIALSITPAVVSLTGTRVYDGLIDADFSILSSGGSVNGVNGQTLTLSGSGTLMSRNAGTEPLSPSSLTLANGTGGNPGAASNYTLVGGTDSVNITAATLTYNANPASQFYGTTPTGLSGTVSGYATGDTLANSTTGTAAFTTLATSSSNVGQYAINGAGLTANNGNYTFAAAAGNATALSITPAVVSLTGTRAYDGLTDADFSILSSGGSVNGVNGQTLTLSGSGTLLSKNAGTQTLSPTGLTLADGTGGSAGAANNYTLLGGAGSVIVTAAVVNLSGNRVYDALSDAPAAIFGINGTVNTGIGSETLMLSGTGTLSSKNVANNAVLSSAGTLTLNDTTGVNAGLASNYMLTGGADTVSVTPLAITVTASSANKVYDGNLAANVTFGRNGVLGNDDVSFANTSATFNTKDVLTANTVSIIGITDAGSDAGNYTLSNSTTTAAANITPAIVSLVGARVYNADVDAAAGIFGAGGTITGVNAETLALTGASTIISKDAGSRALTSMGTLGLNDGNGGSGGLASNYTLTGGTDTVNVGKLGITVTGTGSNKVYDGTVADAVTLSSTGVIGNDIVTFGNSTAAFNDKMVGTGKPVSVSGITASGVDSGNYTLNNATAATTANITPLGITVTGTGSNKIYDGTLTDSVTLASTGVISGDSVGFGDSTAAFNDKTVGTGKTVSISGITASGADSGNYTLNNRTAATTANITPATLIETANPVTVASGLAPPLSGTLSGFVPGDTAGNSTTGSLAWTTNATLHANPGLYAVDGSGLTALNYVFTQAPANANALSITAAPASAAAPANADAPDNGAAPGLAIPQSVAGLIGLPISAGKIPTPYGVGSADDFGNNTGNAKTGDHPTDNRHLDKFAAHLPLKVVEGGVRMPQDSIL